MKKLGWMLGAAVVVAMAGCQDPNYMAKHGRSGSQNEAQPVATQPVEVEPAQPVDKVAPETPIATEEMHCTCPAGTIHKEKCGCGAPDCQCAVALPPPPPPPPAAEETTSYIVQRGDYLAKISKKYNITIAAIKRANPGMKGDVVRVGQTIKLPGKVEVGVQTKPAMAPAAKPAKPAKAYKPYTGATADYKVKNGDSLGLIAKRHGIGLRQLKELNGLQGDVIRVGKTLKVPAGKADAVKAETKPVAAVPVTPEVKHCSCPAGTVHTEPCTCGAPDCKCTVTPPVATEPPAPVTAVPETVPAETTAPDAAAPAEAPAKPAEESITHVVSEGEDITTLSIFYSLSPSEIRAYNNLGENEELKPGQVIKIPGEKQ